MGAGSWGFTPTILHCLSSALAAGYALALVLLVDATTAEHTRGIRTVTLGILNALASKSPGEVVVAAGPTVQACTSVPTRSVALARTRPGRLLYQRVLLPFDAARIGGGADRVDKVLLLDSYVPLLRPGRRVRYGAFVHDVLPLSHPEYWPPLKRAVKHAAFGSLRRSRATLFVSTQFNADELERLLGVEARIVRYGCGQLTDSEADEALGAPLPERKPYILYVGALEPRKGLSSLLDAFELVVSRGGEHLRLTIAGSGSAAYTRALHERIAASRHHERVRIVARAARREILTLLSEASVLAMPTRAEGFGLPIIEALALGTPVVSSDLPAIRSWAGDAVLYAALNRPTDWVEPLFAAAEAGDARRRQGQALARSYRWRSCAEELLQF